MRTLFGTVVGGIKYRGSLVDGKLLCCCNTCNVIINSLCGTAPASCGFPEFTDPEADPPVTASCPPKYYRRMTRTINWGVNKTLHVVNVAPPESGGRIYNIDYSASINGSHVSELVKQKNSETGECDTFYNCLSGNVVVDLKHKIAIAMIGSPVLGTFEDNYFSNFSQEPTTNADLCGMTITEVIADGRYYGWDIPSLSDGFFPPGSFYQYSHILTFVRIAGNFTIEWGAPTSTTTPTTQTLVWPMGAAVNGESKGSAGSITVTTTLSDEVTLYDSLKELICDEEPCTSEDDPPSANECRYCCTDRDGIREGLAYVDPLTPEGCIIPGSSGMAWEVTDCESPSSRSGQGSRLSLWFKDLIPGATYKATIYYKRCSFARNEDDEVIPPAGCIAGSCAEESSEEYETITDEITFTATDWGEILSLDCGQCDIMFKKCELEDEANDWNLAHPDDPPRTVSCTSGGFDVPTTKETYTWFDSCSLESVPPP